MKSIKPEAISRLPGIPLKYMLYRLHGREFSKPLRRFANTWITSRPQTDNPLKICITGEGYMRVSQGEDIFRVLLATLGFRRFSLELTPLMSFLEYLLDEAELNSLASIEVAEAGGRRKEVLADLKEAAEEAGIQVVDWQVDQPFDQAVHASLGRMPHWLRGVGVEVGGKVGVGVRVRVAVGSALWMIVGASAAP